MSETLWQKAYDEYVQDNSYQCKLKKENDKLKAKLGKIEQIIEQEANEGNECCGCRLNMLIREVLEKE